MTPTRASSPRHRFTKRPAPPRLSFGRAVPQQHRRREQNPLQPQIAPVRPVPLGGGMCAATLAACTDRHRRNSQRQRDVRVCRGAMETRPDAQMSVNSPQIGDQRRIRRKFRQPAGFRSPGFSPPFCSPAPVNSRSPQPAPQRYAEPPPVPRSSRCFRNGYRPSPAPPRNRIDAEAAFDDSHVHSHLRRRAQIERPLVHKERDGAAQRVDRIPDTEIAPAMAAWPGKGNFEAPAPERLPRDVVGRRSVQHQKCGDALRQFRLPADMRIPQRFPSPSSPTFAISSNRFHSPLILSAVWGKDFIAFAMASSAASPAPLSETPGPRRSPSRSIATSSFVRGASTVSRCAVTATSGPPGVASSDASTFPARSMAACQPSARNCASIHSARCCSRNVGAGTRHNCR